MREAAQAILDFQSEYTESGGGGPISRAVLSDLIAEAYAPSLPTPPKEGWELFWRDPETLLLYKYHPGQVPYAATKDSK